MTISRSWVPAMILVAAAYTAVGVGFGALANPANPAVMRFWRLAAWVVCLAIALGYILYEHVARRSPPRANATHAAAAVALGAFGLALAACIHWVAIGSPAGRSPVSALPLWPIITAIPAFLAAWAAAAILARLSPRA